MPNFDFLYYLSIFLALSREPRRGDFICCISLIIIILSPSCRLKMCFLNKKRIKIKNKNSILIQSKMALPNMWFGKVGSISREQKMWLVAKYPAETEREEDDEELSRSKPNQSSKHQHLSRCEIEFLNLQIPHPSFSSSSRKKLKTSVNKSFFRHRPQHLYLVVLHRVDKLVVAALQQSF